MTEFAPYKMRMLIIIYTSPVEFVSVVCPLSVRDGSRLWGSFQERKFLGSDGSRNHVIPGSDKDQIEIEILDDSDSDR